MWQQMLRESKLDNVIMLLLGDAIAKGELPYHKNWLTWDWYFPAKPTIDVGRESEANIEEINAGLNTGANVVSESGQGDIEEVIIQRGHEVGMMIDAAQDEAKQRGLDWEQVYALMIPPPRGRGQGGGMPAAAGIAADKVAAQNGDKPGATDEGVEIDGSNGKGDGRSIKRFEIPGDFLTRFGGGDGGYRQGTKLATRLARVLAIEDDTIFLREAEKVVNGVVEEPEPQPAEVPPPQPQVINLNVEKAAAPARKSFIIKRADGTVIEGELYQSHTTEE
jgi:hypothetical protein